MSRTSDKPNKEVAGGELPFLLQGAEASAQDALNLLGLNLECARECLAQAGKGDVSARQAELSALLQGASVAYNRLERLQDQMARLMECAQGAAQPTWRRVELCGLLRGICSQAELLRASLGVELVLDLPSQGQAEVEIAADPDYLVQVVLQLLSNALRACRPGGHVRVQLLVAEAGQNELQLRIQDDGCGLPQQEQQAAEQGENRQCFLGGNGLGLPLCRAYCALLGWTLTLAGGHEGGTEAVLRVPMREECGEIAPSPGIASAVWEETTRQQLLHQALRRELRSVPGLETAEFE
jgi:signal transduction histidine kinase